MTGVPRVIHHGVRRAAEVCKSSCDAGPAGMKFLACFYAHQQEADPL